jgi:hypothetical protein
MSKENTIKEEKLKKYFEITGKALVMAKKALDNKRKAEAEEVLDMASRYYEDAKWFEKKGNFVNAFAALNYAHGWLDCGARIGLFKVKDSNLFVIK